MQWVVLGNADFFQLVKGSTVCLNMNVRGLFACVVSTVGRIGYEVGFASTGTVGKLVLRPLLSKLAQNSAGGLVENDIFWNVKCF